LDKTLLLLLESVVIAGYYAWFGYFDTVVGGNGGDEIVWETTGGVRVTAFGFWVSVRTFPYRPLPLSRDPLQMTASLALTITTHAFAFHIKAKKSFERAEFDYVYRDEVNPDKIVKRAKDIHLHASDATYDLITTILTCASVFAWDWTVKSLARNQAEFVWAYVGATLVVSSLTLLIAQSYFIICCNRQLGNRQMICCMTCTCKDESSKPELDATVLETARGHTVESCMVMLLHNLALLTGLTLNYAFTVSLSKPLSAMDDTSAILLKWAISIGVIGVALLVIRFRRVIIGRAKPKQAIVGQLTQQESTSSPLDYMDHSLILTAALSLFEAIYFTLYTLTPPTSSEQVYAFLIALVVVAIVGSLAVYLMQQVVQQYVFEAMVWEGTQTTANAPKQEDHNIAFVSRMVEFVIIGISYIVGKLFYYSCYHWLKNRAAKNLGVGLQTELLLLAVAISAGALVLTVLVSGVFRRRMEKQKDKLHEQIDMLQKKSASIVLTTGGKMVV
jgi:hypothetical protein